MKKRFLIHDNYHNKGRNMSASKVVKKHIGVLLCMFMMMVSVIPSGIIKAETSTSTVASSVKYGDLNGDGAVSILDYGKLKSFLLGSVSTIDKTAADLNGDEKINSIDLALMQRFILGKITKFPADKSTGTITDIKPKFVEGLKAKLETISIIYTGDTTDFNNQLNQLVSAVLKEDANGYNVASIQYSASGTAGNLTITYKIEYTAEVQGAKTIDEVKSKLIEGLTAKQQKIEVTYTGDVTDLSSNISQLVASVLSENAQCYNVKTSSYSMSGIVGNVAITFEFTYSDGTIVAADTLADMKTAIGDGFKNRSTEFSIIYKGDLTTLTDDIKNNVEQILEQDSYLKYSILSYQCNITEDQVNATLDFNCKYLTTKEQEDYVDNKVDLILSNIIDPKMSEDKKEKVIHDYILLNVGYYDSTDGENSKLSAYDALHDGETVCQGYALLASKMLTKAGIDNKIIDGNNHAWNQVKINGNWYHLDCTWDDVKNNTLYYKYYNLTDEKISLDHVWDSSTAEKCQTDYIAELQKHQDDLELQEILKGILK